MMIYIFLNVYGLSFSLIVLIPLSWLVSRITCTTGNIFTHCSFVKSGVMAVRCFLSMGLGSNAEIVMTLTSVKLVLKLGSITPDILLAE